MNRKATQLTDVRSLARSFAPLCIKSLAGIVQNGESESARVAAAGMLLDRGYGRAPTALDPDGGDVIVTIRQITARIGDAMRVIEHDDVSLTAESEEPSALMQETPEPQR
jgi:hypothetical protein